MHSRRTKTLKDLNQEKANDTANDILTNYSLKTWSEYRDTWFQLMQALNTITHEIMFEFVKTLTQHLISFHLWKAVIALHHWCHTKDPFVPEGTVLNLTASQQPLTSLWAVNKDKRWKKHKTTLWLTSAQSTIRWSTQQPYSSLFRNCWFEKTSYTCTSNPTPKAAFFTPEVV